MVVSKNIIVLLIGCLTVVNSEYSLKLSTNDITVIVDNSKSFDLLLNGFVDRDVNVTFVEAHEGLAELNPIEILINKESQQQENVSFLVEVLGKKAGHLEVRTKVNGAFDEQNKNLFLRILVANANSIIYISIVIGWIYFAAWSISFYPQIWVNYKRKSVVGLNFDFIALNIVGFIMYSLFNIGLYWIPEIQEEYAARYPTGVNPVLLNDVVFALHAVFATSITIYQCFKYERAEQRISVTARSILGLFLVVILISMGLVAGDVILWLDFLYICSYIKLAISLIKYIPQAIMNYRRKSTQGWSIGNILLDFTGGSLSMLQMILNAYNYDDWASLFGDPTKFGLGLFSVLFDIFFILQHYIFYRNTNYEEILGANEEEPEVSYLINRHNKRNI